MKVILNNQRVDGIPILEYYIEGETPKGLIFIQHGYQSTKEYGCDFLALELARRGYLVVAIDAYKHGERKEEPYSTGTEIERLNEAFIVVKKTALDIIRLFRNHYTTYKTFDFIGISLGGMVGYYLATKTSKVRKLLPIISTPDFMAQARYAVLNEGILLEDFFNQEKLQFIDSIDPLKHLDDLRFEELFAACGKKDQVVPMKETVQFFNEHETDQMMLKIYETNHSVPRDMQLDIFNFIDKQ